VGTSDGYQGSGGAWNGAQRTLDDLLSGGDSATDDVCADAAGALQWEVGDGDSADGQSGETDVATLEIPTVGSEAVPITIRPRGSGGGGDVGVGVGARRSGGRPTPGGSGGRGRSRRRAASTGARVAAAGYALRAGDATALRTLGLELAELVGLSPAQQAKRIIDVIVGTTATIEDAEIARASSSMIIALLERTTEPTPAEVVRIFAVEYVYEVFLTELGAEMRDGSRNGSASIVTENDIRDLIEARVASLQIEGDAVDAGALESAFDEVLEFTRRIIHERPAE